MEGTREENEYRKNLIMSRYQPRGKRSTGRPMKRWPPWQDSRRRRRRRRRKKKKKKKKKIFFWRRTS